MALTHTLPPLCTADLFELEKVQVDYISMPGWNTSITHTKSFDDLPINTKAYVKKLEELTGTPSKKEVKLVYPVIHIWSSLLQYNGLELDLGEMTSSEYFECHVVWTLFRCVGS